MCWKLEHEHCVCGITWPEIAGVALLTGVSLFCRLVSENFAGRDEPAVKALLAGGGQ